MFSVKCGLIAITRGDTGLITVEPKDGYTPTPKDRAFFTVAQMPDAKTVISKVVTPDESGVVRIPLMSADTNDLPKDRQREYTWSLRYALDAVMTGDAVTGWREMITPIPAGQFVVLEANDFPSGVSCPEDERLPVKIESLKGERGEQGERGERGEKGEKGDRGEKGERGERGIQGAQGEKGDALRFDDLTLEQKAQLKGERGERGEKGEQGERGERGVQGIQGATGAQGRQGDTGLRGAKGDPFVYADFTPEQLAALKGEPGKDGAPGEPGKDAPQEAVLYTAQTLDEAQKAQARENIGAADASLQNVLVGSETGNPITVDDAFAAPLCGLTVYGKSTQDGTPSPDNPVPIVSAGDGGSVAVEVTGANVLEGTKPGVELTPQGATYTIHENGISITGTAINLFTILLHDDVRRPLTRDTYYLTTSGLSSSVTLNFYFVGKFSSDMQNQKVTLSRDVDFSLRLQIEKGTTLNTTVQVSLTRNKIATYSPYHEQLLMLPTPNGLPGIPVTSGGNYTDPQGQQWVCDEVDFGKGVKVQRVDKAAFDSTKTLAEQNAILATPVETPLTPAEIAAYKALTAYVPDTVVQASDGAGVKLGYQRDVNIVIKKLEDAIASMTAT